MKITASVSGLTEALNNATIKARMGAMKAMSRAGTALKDDLRAQITAAGLSYKLAKTWQSKIYPVSGDSLEPAAYVFSKAPNIITAYAKGVTIVAKAGRRLLAVPTDDTPLKRQGNALTPKEVEARYGKRLRFVPAKSAQSSALGGRATGYLLMDGLVMKDRGNRHRNASQRELRLANQVGKAKPVSSVVMFALVASVRVPKKLDLQGALDSAAATLPQLMAEEWGQ